jgi:alcohol dehydrogenase (NADP+)
LGTFGSDKYSGEEVATAVLGAAEAGYRQFDCASVYSNEDHVGKSLETIIKGGLSREELWVTSKLWNNHHDARDVIPACEKSLQDLRLDYLDLYLIHWPFPNFHAPKVENYLKTWRQMEKLHERGLVRHIGTSNMTIPKLELLIRDAEIKPAANEMELHPHFQQPELFDYVVAHGMIPIGYCPLGSPSRPERDRTPEDTVDVEDGVIKEIAARLQMTPAAVCIAWAVQRGQVPIPFSVKPNQYIDSLNAAASAPLSSDDMAALAKIDKRCRLIKGQVFTWVGAKGWEDLWDE